MIYASVLIYSAFAQTQIIRTTTTTTTPHCEYGYKNCCWVNAPDGCGTDYLNSIAGDSFKSEEYDVSDFQLTHKPSGWVAVYNFDNVVGGKPGNHDEDSCKEVVKELQDKCERPNKSDIPEDYLNHWNINGCEIPSKIQTTNPFFDGFENFNGHVTKYPKSCKASRPLCGRNKWLNIPMPDDFQDCESNKKPAKIQSSKEHFNPDYINKGDATLIMDSDSLKKTYLNCTKEQDCHIIIDFGASDSSKWTVCKANLIEIVVVTEPKQIINDNGVVVNDVLTLYNDPLQGDVTFMQDNGGDDMPNWDDENWTHRIKLDDRNNGFFPVGGLSELKENGAINFQGSLRSNFCTSDRFCSVFIYVEDNVSFRFMKLKLFKHANTTIPQNNVIEEVGKILLRDINVTGKCDLKDSTTTSTTTKAKSTIPLTTQSKSTTATVTTTDGTEADDKEKNNTLIYAVVGSCIGVAALGGSLLYYKKKKKKETLISKFISLSQNPKTLSSYY